MIVCPNCKAKNEDDRTECYECFRKLDNDYFASENNKEEASNDAYESHYNIQKPKQDTYATAPKKSFHFPTNIDDILGKALVEKYKSKCLKCKRRIGETDLICSSCGYDNRTGNLNNNFRKQERQISERFDSVSPSRERNSKEYEPQKQANFRTRRKADYVLRSDIKFKSSPQKIAIYTEKTAITTKLDEYYVVGVIGRGGFSHIYKVQNQAYQIYALKLLNLWQLEPYMYAEFRERFNREHQIGLANHQNLVRHIEKGFLEGNPFSIMEFCEGGDLRTKIVEGTKWTELQATDLALQILNGLSILHSQQIYHRDLKPANVLFRKNGRVLLSDFGIAGFVNGRSTILQSDGKVSHLVGTREYMAPEQTDFVKSFYSLGPTTDIFSFGVLMYEVFSGGKQPYGLAASASFNQRRLDSKFTPLIHFRNDISTKWQALIHKCLQGNEKERYQNVQEIINELEQIKKQVYRGTNQVYMQANNASQKAALLRTIVGDAKGKTFDLEAILLEKNAVRLTVGWENPQKPFENDIAISERFSQHISSYHATIEYIEGRWHLTDGQWRSKNGQYGWHPSTNGVFVNHQKIGSGKYCLQVNDIITIGKVQLQYVLKASINEYDLKTTVFGT